MVAILPDHQRQEIARAVQAMYTDVARQPTAGFHFPTGRAAASVLGYPDDLLAQVPDAALASFAGVAYPFECDVVRAGYVVLDVGAGSGTDAFIARSLVGSSGRVIAVDVTAAMLERLQNTAAQAGTDGIHTLLGDAESIPLPANTVDVVTTNGAINLVLDKQRAFSELWRVLRPGGWLQFADVLLGQPVTEACRADPKLWVECVVGATLEGRLYELLQGAGFGQIEVLRHVDYFAASPSRDTREIAAALHAESIVLRARKPAGAQ